MTNYLKRHKERFPGGLGAVTELANAREADLSAENRQYLNGILAGAWEEFAKTGVEPARRASAELNALAGFYDGQLAGRNADLHFLLHSDTYIGKRTASLLERWSAVRRPRHL